jgi:hypothetical protein
MIKSSADIGAFVTLYTFYFLQHKICVADIHIYTYILQSNTEYKIEHSAK